MIAWGLINTRWIFFTGSTWSCQFVPVLSLHYCRDLCVCSCVRSDCSWLLPSHFDAHDTLFVPLTRCHLFSLYTISIFLIVSVKLSSFSSSFSNHDQLSHFFDCSASFSVTRVHKCPTTPSNLIHDAWLICLGFFLTNNFIQSLWNICAFSWFIIQERSDQ